MTSVNGSAQPPTRRRGVLDRPILDWLLVAIATFIVPRYTPLVALFTATEVDGQRAAMGSMSSLLANVAAFGVAALFAYSALENATTRRMRARWGPHLTGVFLRSLGVMFLAATICGFTAVSVPHPAGAITFLAASLAGFVKLLRLLGVVGSLLKGQDRLLAVTSGSGPGVAGWPAGRAAALNLRNLIGRGLTRVDRTWALAT